MIYDQQFLNDLPLGRLVSLQYASSNVAHPPIRLDDAERNKMFNGIALAPTSIDVGFACPVDGTS
ncbi:hypothetical protein BLOT_005887 [Blomia tropicalis]|nr:hypothetical protein BLOT_005887 [Blomia tropicalis]